MDSHYGSGTQTHRQIGNDLARVDVAAKRLK
jgi:hypothetical protein